MRNIKNKETSLLFLCNSNTI